MTDGKKDVLEFPLEELEVPQAIALMMQAATKCVHHGMAHADPLLTDDVRLQELAEKLEARVEDAIDAAKAVRDESVPEDAPNEPIYTNLDGHKVSLVEEYVDEAMDSIITKVIVDNLIYVLICNENVALDDEENMSRCIKAWGHSYPSHEDMEGNFR